MQPSPVSRNDLPEEWRAAPQTVAQLQQAARANGIDTTGMDMAKFRCFVAFSGPECPESFMCQRAVMADGRPGLVGIAIQHPRTWAESQAAAGKPSSIADWLQFVRENGRPPDWCLVRIFGN
jgi:hypothetical protein